MRLLEEQETKHELPRYALIDGENSGPSAPSDLEAFIAEQRGKATQPE